MGDAMSQLELLSPGGPPPRAKKPRAPRKPKVASLAPAVVVAAALRPLLFLDFDGVVADAHPTKSAEERLRKRCVAILNTVVERTGCLVVVSSMWRFDPRTGRGFGGPQLEAWLKGAGFVGEVIGITPTLPGDGVRGLEIQAWIDENGVETSRRFAIVDDWEPMGALTPRLVRTDYNAGITAANADALVKLLGEKTR